MKKLLAVFGIAAACSVCCAPLLLPLLSGFAGSSLGFLLGWEAAVVAGVAVAAVAMVLRRRQAKAAACRPVSDVATASGCGGGCATAKRGAA